MSGFGAGRLGFAAMRGEREGMDALWRAGPDWLTVDNGEDAGWQAICHCSACGGAKAHTPEEVQQLTIPGDTTSTETLAIGGSRTGDIETVGDDDFYRVELVAGQHYVFTMTGNGGSPLADCYLELYDSSGTLIALDDDAGPGTDSLMRFTAVTSGTYYVNARAYEDPDTGQNNTGGYLLAAAIGAAQNPLNTINLNFTVSQQNITVYFAPQGYQNPLNDTALRDWTAGEISAAFAAFATFSDITNLTFTQVFTQAGARFVMSLADLEPGTLGYFATTGGVGYGAFDPAGNGWSNGLAPGGLGFVTLIHEIGHGLGLAHPQDNGGNSEVMQGVVSDFNSYGTFEMNQGVFTTMTYNDGFPLQPGGSFSNSQFGAQATPMPLDIALLQQKYGADPNTNSGNNTYTLVDANAVGTRYVGIWDTGGVDEIVYSGSRNTVIDLRPATLLNAQGGGGYVSYATGIWGGYVIAAGVTIENATGGLGSDTLTGNDAANVLTGNFGDDVLRGGAGADTLIGGDGNDTLDDTVGLNTYNGGSGTDFASVSLASRTGALSYTVGDAAITENGSALITFSDIEHVSIVGGSGNDVFVGGSFNDTLIGGAGIDTLTGGFGNDVYGVDSLQDIVNEAPGADIDTVETTLTNVGLSSFTNIEVLTYVGTAAFIGQGTSGANTINGGSGNDYIYAYGGDDLARGNAGIDVFILGDGSDTAFGGDGQDYLFGDLGNDFLHGEGGVDVLLAGDGDDTMFGGDSGDYFYGEDGNDTAFGDAGNDIFVLTAGNDEATGGDGQDYFYMGDGNDTLNGEGGVDVMLGEAGNDTFNPGLGVDYVFMGTGSDRLNVHFFNSGVTVLNDFTPGDGSADVIGLVGPFVTFADVQASISDFTTSGGFCILTLDADTSIWFIGVSPSQLTAGDFILGGG